MKIDEGVKAAMVVVAAYLIKLAFEAAGLPLDEQIYFTIAGVVVTILLALLGFEAVKALFIKIRPQSRNLFK